MDWPWVHSLLFAGIYEKVLKLLKPLHDYTHLHNAFLEYCLPPFITQKLTMLMDAVRTLLLILIVHDWPAIYILYVLFFLLVIKYKELSLFINFIAQVHYRKESTSKEHRHRVYSHPGWALLWSWHQTGSDKVPDHCMWCLQNVPWILHMEFDYYSHPR